MNKDEMQERTKAFALRIINLVRSLPKNSLGDVLGRQILKAGTSIGANYREALRASSRKHYITNLEIAEREAAETLYFLELIAYSNLVKPALMQDLMDECRQLLAILTASGRTAKDKLRITKIRNSKSEIRNQPS